MKKRVDDVYHYEDLKRIDERETFISEFKIKEERER